MRSRPSNPAFVLLLVVATTIAGCGEPLQVTYVDPNGDIGGGQAGGATAEPIERFGVDNIERAQSIVRIRAALAVARTVSATEPSAAAQAIGSAVREDLPFLEPRLTIRDARVATSLRRSLQGLANHPPTNAVQYAGEVRRISESLLTRAAELVIPTPARQDIGFRAALLHETLIAAAMDYEAAFDGGTTAITKPDRYRRAYGLLIDASTRQLEAVPESGRGAVRAALDRVSRRTLPGPTPPVDPRNPDNVVGELGAIADQVAQYAGIDTIYPPTPPNTPDQLRSLKRNVAASVESWERGDRSGALRQLAAADQEHLQPAASGVATVSTTLLQQVERGVLVQLPAAMRARREVVSVGADLDATLDEAITQVETELELLRDSS